MFPNTLKACNKIARGKRRFGAPPLDKVLFILREPALAGESGCDFHNINHDASAAARSAGFEYFHRRVPGVPLRSTLGSMLTPASRVRPFPRLAIPLGTAHCSPLTDDVSNLSNLWI